MPTLSKLKVIIDGDNSGLSQTLRQSQRAVEGFAGSAGSSLSSLGKQMSLAGAGLTLGVTAPIVAMGKKSIESAAEFEQSMNVLKVVSNATNSQIAALSKTAVQLGADTSLPATSALDAAKAMLELSKAGLSVKDTMAATKGTLQLSAAAQIQATEAAKLTAAALTSFNLPGREAVRIADMLAAASIAAQGEITDMGAALKQTGAVAHLAGQNVGDTVTAIGLMAQAGIVGSDAGTSLKTMFIRLMAPTDEAKKAMEQFGIKTRDASGHLLKLPQLVNEFNRALGPGAKITTAMGGSVEDMNKALAKAQKTANEAGKDMRVLPLVIQAQQAQYAQLAQRLREADLPAQTLSRTITDQKNRLQDLRQEMERHVRDALSRMNRENIQATGRIKETTLEIQAQERQLKQLKSELATIGSTQGAGSDAYKDMQLEVVRLTNRIQDNKFSIEDWNKQLAENQRQMAQGVDGEKDKKRAIDDLTKSITENQSKLATMQGPKGDAETAQMKAQMAQLTESIRENQEALAKAPEAFKALEIAKRNATLVTRQITDAERDQALQTIFGTDAIRAASIVLLSSKGSWDQMSRSINAQGTAAKLAAAINTGLKGSLDALKSSMDTLMQQGAAPFLNVLTKLVREGVIPIVEKFAALPAGMQRNIVLFGGLAAAAGPLLTILGGLVTVIGAIATPTGLAVAAIVALGVAFATNVGGIRDKTMAVLKPAVDFIKQQFETVKTWFVQNLPLIRETVQTVLTTIAEFWKRHGEQILAYIRPLWETIKGIVSTFVQWLLGALKMLMQIINGDWSGAWETFKQTTVKVWSGIGSIIKAGAQAVVASLSFLWDFAKDLGARLWHAFVDVGRNIVQGIIAGLKEYGPQILRSLIDFVAPVAPAVRQLLGIRSPSTVFADIGQNTVAGFAQGVATNAASALRAVKDMFAGVVNVGANGQPLSQTQLMQLYGTTNFDRATLDSINPSAPMYPAYQDPGSQPSGMGGKGSAPITVNINMNIQATDAESFRYSKTQTAQTLAEATKMALLRNG